MIMRHLTNMKWIPIFLSSVCLTPENSIAVQSSSKEATTRPYSYFQASAETEIYEIRTRRLKIPLGKIEKNSWVRTIGMSTEIWKGYQLIEHQSGLIGYIESKYIHSSPTQEKLFQNKQGKFSYIDETQSELTEYTFDKGRIESGQFFEVQKWNPKSIYFIPGIDTSISCGVDKFRNCNQEKPHDPAFRAFLRHSVKILKNRLKEIQTAYAPGVLNNSRLLAIQVINDRIKFDEFLIEFLLTGDVNPFFEIFPNAKKITIQDALNKINQQYPSQDSLPRWEMTRSVLEEAQFVKPYGEIRGDYSGNWAIFLKEMNVKIKTKCIANCNE